MNIPPEYKAQIKKAIFLTKLNVWIEKCWPVILSFLSWWGIYLCFGLLGIPQYLPDIGRAIILIIGVIGSIGFVIYQIKRFSLPSFQQILQRIELLNKLPHHPLQTLYDTPIKTGSAAAWNAHLQRIFANFPRLKVSGPRILKGHYHINRFAIVTLCIFTAIFISNERFASSRLLSAIRPGYDDISTPLPNFQAWIIPPSYSNAAPIYIKSRTETIATDPKARIHIALTGLKQRPNFINPKKIIVINNISFQQPEPNQWQIEGTIENSGLLRIKARGRIIASWKFNLPDNSPPKITWAGPIEKSKYDWKTAFPFEASQHYGIQSVRLTVTVPQNKEHPQKEILSLTQPLGDHPKKISQTLHKDLSSNIFAGNQAQAIISATDVTGQTTTSDKVTFTLPKRIFSSPIAQKLDQIRQAYGTDQLTKENTINELIQLQNIPNAFQDYDLYLNYISIIYFLDNANENSPQVKAEALSRLWDLIIDTEERKNSNSEIAKANIELRAAQASVQEQLDKMQRLGKDKITNQDRQELNRRLERLQNAVAQKMMALAKQNTKDNPQEDHSKEMQFTSTHSFEDLFKDMAKTMENGNMDKAMQQLEYTNQVLNTMRSATPADIKKLEDHLKSQKEMQNLTQDIEKLTKQQQDLLNQTYARLNLSVPLILRPNQDLNQLSTPDLINQITPHNTQEKPTPDLPSSEQTAKTQHALIETLTKLQIQIQKITKQPIQNLDLAQRNMQAAYQALLDKNDNKAADEQQKALVNLQKGKDSAKQNMQQQAQRFSNFFPVFSARNPQEDPSSDNEVDVNKKKDPLGRSENNSQIDLSGNASSARKIEEELRKRADDPNRSEKDLDYIYRLLNMF